MSERNARTSSRILAFVALALGLVFVPLDDANAQGRAREAKITVFVGPQTRDGFADIDLGILDSIKDIQRELRRSARFTVVSADNQAVIVLTVIGRRTPGSSGAIGLPIGAVTMLFPVKRRAIDTILKVGTYEKATTSEAEDNDAWRESAERVVRDVAAWVDANWSVLLAEEKKVRGDVR